jgi:hypothetical protein
MPFKKPGPLELLLTNGGEMNDIPIPRALVNLIHFDPNRVHLQPKFGFPSPDNAEPKTPGALWAVSSGAVSGTRNSDPSAST